MLESTGTIDIDFTIFVASKHDWRHLTEVRRESYYSFRGAVLITISVLVKVRDDWVQVVLLEIPDLEATIICHGGKAGGRIW